MITCTVYEPFLHELSGKSAPDSSVAAVKKPTLVSWLVK
jgi:hypothetical protein